MYKYLYLLLCISGGMMLVSCKKFLDIRASSTTVNPTKISDFQEMLNNDSLGTNNNLLADLITDDITMSNNHLQSDNNFSRTYLWNSIIWGSADQDWMYNGYYSRILQLNIILDRIGNAEADSLNTEETRSTIISEAKIHRAWYYLQLANIYGPAYNATTAATDLAVPLILTPDASARPARSSVATTYNQVLADLTDAVNSTYLPARGRNIIHPGKASGFALLARTYLYMGNYDDAQRFADSALQLQSALLDYNKKYFQPNQLTDLSAHPEIMLGRVSIDRGYYKTYTAPHLIGATLKTLLGTADLRYTRLFYQDIFRSGFLNGVSVITTDNSVGVPEVMLIKAECLARKGSVADAGALVDQLRKNRFTASSYTSRTYTTDNILSYVLDERRRELVYYGGLRLFDLKRLNKDAAYQKDLTRTSGTTELARLPAGSPKYLFPFAPLVISNNLNIVQNPR